MGNRLNSIAKINKTELSFVFLGALVVVALLVKIFAPSGTWICYQGKWVKQGAPKEAKPTTSCAVVPPVLETSSEPLLSPQITDNMTSDSAAVTAKEVVLTSPQAGTAVSSPLAVKGEAPGSWFFEGNIIVELQDDKHQVITTHPGTAQTNWMTEAAVPFASLVEFTTTAKTGYLVVRNDNPSGLAEFSKTAEWPLIFLQAAPAVK